MPRSVSVYLNDMLRACEKIARYGGGLGRESFAADERTIDAVIRNLEIVGEAAKRVPDDIRRLHPQIAWKRIAGMRDLLIHDYSGVDLDVVWDVVENKIPDLQRRLKEILTA